MGFRNKEPGTTHHGVGIYKKQTGVWPYAKPCDDQATINATKCFLSHTSTPYMFSLSHLTKTPTIWYR